MAAKFKMAATTCVFSLFLPQKFSFSLKRVAVARCNNAFQKAGHLRSSKKYDRHSERIAYRCGYTWIKNYPDIGILSVLRDNSIILIRNTRATYIKFGMYLAFH